MSDRDFSEGVLLVIAAVLVGILIGLKVAPQPEPCKARCCDPEYREGAERLRRVGSEMLRFRRENGKDG